MKRFINRMVLTLVLLFTLCQDVQAVQLLVPSGQIIGLELADNTVTVAAFDSAMSANAQAAGLQVGDRITHIDKQAITSAQDVRRVLERSDGQVDVSVMRNGKTKQLQITPHITVDGPRLGVYLKQGITGVGTVTWYDPTSGKFGALGHGVNSQSGELIRMNRGKAYKATIVSIKKGKAGEPGQLLGNLQAEEPIGVLSRNTARGVFGTADVVFPGEPLPVAEPEQIHTGNAIIRSTIQGNTVQEYSVEILKIYPNSKADGRNMLLRITDPDLLTATGGIVQGMSGSPIIQDGKLIGAVTHVLVNDPTTGYGIFIENMLDAAA